MSSPRTDTPAAADQARAGGAAPAAETPPKAGTTRAELAELQRQGAKAAVRGDPQASNPMLDAINQPESTGESTEVWSSRREAWAHGHAMREVAHRAGSPPAPGRAEGRAPAAPAIRHGQDEALFGVTRILTFAGQQGMTAASGFFFENLGRLFLVTSRHVLHDTASGHAPDRIEIQLHTDPRDLTRLATLSILLYREGQAVWRQARDSGGDVDVAALELDRSAMPADSVLRPFGPQHLAVGYECFEVGDRLAIPGFPLGFFDTVHHLPVVRQASVASEYGIRFQGHGYFLTDARMHRGSSGSPVLARLAPAGPDQPRWCLLGVHSSRMDMATRDATVDESLGLNCAWYADVLLTLTG